MVQKIINLLYRNPKSKWSNYRRFGGYLAYKDMQASHQQMMLASHQLPPVRSSSDGLPIYFLTGKNYIHQTLFCIHSLVKVSGEEFYFHLVDDGSFDGKLIERIEKQLPNARMITSKEINQHIAQTLPPAHYPNLNRKRAEYAHIKKLTDVHSYPDGQDFKLVLDSDMLFWKNPVEMITWLKDPLTSLHMVDCGEAYGYPHRLLEKLTKQPVSKLVNVGAIGLNSKAIDWKKMDHWIDEMETVNGKSYYLEQALSAMLIGNNKATVLPAEKYQVLPDLVDLNDGATLHHYVDVSKKTYYSDAWKKLIYE